jgi:hypothetical protein
VRNRAGNALLRWLVKPIIAEINTYRAEHGLRLLEGDNLGEGSARAHIAQQPASFDYPRRRCPNVFTTADRGAIHLVVASERCSRGRNWMAAP